MRVYLRPHADRCGSEGLPGGSCCQVCGSVVYLRPHAVWDAPQHQGAEAVGAGQVGGDDVPGEVTHRVVVGELQVGLPAQPLLGVLAVGGPVSTRTLLGVPNLEGALTAWLLRALWGRGGGLDWFSFWVTVIDHFRSVVLESTCQ